jgi:hypothetical protein
MLMDLTNARPTWPPRRVRYNFCKKTRCRLNSKTLDVFSPLTQQDREKILDITVNYLFILLLRQLINPSHAKIVKKSASASPIRFATSIPVCSHIYVTMECIHVLYYKDLYIGQYTNTLYREGMYPCASLEGPVHWPNWKRAGGLSRAGRSERRMKSL